MKDQWFDDLSRRLAAPVTRRQAFKTIAAAALGGVLVRFGTGEAFGQGNDDCAHFCDDQFPPGPKRGQCKSDAAQGSGPCYQCGPASNSCGLTVCNGVCCAKDASCNNGTCACPTGHGVCGAGSAACSGVGTCTDLTTIQNCGSCGNACAPDQTCTNGKCQSSNPNPECAGKGCGSLNLMCNNDPNCVCTTLFGGARGFCMCAQVQCLGLTRCPNGNECNPGELCLIQTCCGDNVCVPSSFGCPCRSTTTTMNVTLASRTSFRHGPTIGTSPRGQPV